VLLKELCTWFKIPVMNIELGQWTSGLASIIFFFLKNQCTSIGQHTKATTVECNYRVEPPMNIHEWHEFPWEPWIFMRAVKGHSASLVATGLEQWWLVSERLPLGKWIFFIVSKLSHVKLFLCLCFFLMQEKNRISSWWFFFLEFHKLNVPLSR